MRLIEPDKGPKAQGIGGPPDEELPFSEGRLKEANSAAGSCQT
jgi:hypothetical protein